MQNKAIIYWLYFTCFMVFAMAVIGAVTRLSEAGLSMVEWRPLIGWIPPMNEQEWQRVYDLYKQSPEFEHKHYWMEMADFKRIFFWEWLHRLWGRMIGIVFAVPLLWFWARKQIPQGYGWKFAGLFILGGMQGVLGWWMVKSGLADRPDVSHYRLAAHLSLALILFALIWWCALDLKGGEKKSVKKGTYMHALGTLAFLAITIIWGAFVAGLDAGKIYNSWPLMNGSFLPPESFSSSSLLDQHAWVQFFHRWIAIVTTIAVVGLSIRTKDMWLGAMVFIQVGLGIVTLLSQVALHPAATHQAGAIILLALLIKNIHSLKISEK